MGALSLNSRATQASAPAVALPRAAPAPAWGVPAPDSGLGGGFSGGMPTLWGAAGEADDEDDDGDFSGAQWGSPADGGAKGGSTKNSAGNMCVMWDDY